MGTFTHSIALPRPRNLTPLAAAARVTQNLSPSLVRSFIPVRTGDTWSPAPTGDTLPPPANRLRGRLRRWKCQGPGGRPYVAVWAIK